MSITSIFPVKHFAFLHLQHLFIYCVQLYTLSLIPLLPTAAALSSFSGPSLCLIFSSYPPSFLLPSPTTPCRRLKYEETIKLWLICIWTGGRRATTEMTTEPWKSTAELFWNPRNDFLSVLCRMRQSLPLPVLSRSQITIRIREHKKTTECLYSGRSKNGDYRISVQTE